ncbi:MAG: potassium channel family protein [Edaphobacter sp.]|uniref:potassium channel family protein n=1 Tax=Edaphobacter sp. TaxID=1934404 RepID=UPI00238EDA0D|nr:potassium channel family protein [Edaphobacter sp.]MDE1176472.1 potassium channel family protein [Edaphobacter sp.]
MAALIAGVLCCLAVFVDAFQTIILPRRATGRFRLTRFFFILTWTPWTAIGGRMKNAKAREQFYSFYGPLSLILLLLLWGLLLIFSFATFYFALGTPFIDPLGLHVLHGVSRFRTDLYVSGTTLFTLGLGDVVPHSIVARALIILESGVGLGFVALVIGYLPVLYQAFSRREVSIALLDARAGSPPTAAELLRRHGFEGGEEALIELLMEWERWSAEILESHISYPILCFYRSQHDNQSWLSALVAMLDTCALLISVLEGPASRQAQLTFVMARHALIDLGNVFHVKEQRAWSIQQEQERMPAADFDSLCDVLTEMGLRLCGDRASAERLETVRALYEPHAGALSHYLRMPLPPWVTEKRDKDQWKLLNKLRTEAEATRGQDATQYRRRVASALLHDEHGH